MESRKPYQEHQINIHETGRVASKANERSGWQLNGVIDSSQGLSHLEPRPGNPIDFQSNPVAPGMVTGWPSMQHPLHGRADTTTRTDFNESYFTDSNMWNAPAQGSDCLDATNAFTNGVHEVRNRLDPFPSAFVSQGSASRNIHDRSEYMQVWPQGGNYEPRACHSGSEYRGQGNYSLPRYPIDPYVMPSGAQLPDLPILGTHSPDNIDHDSPGAPAILHKERIGSYMAQNDPWSPEKARWSANNTTTIDEGFPQTPDDPGSSQPQTHYPHVTDTGMVIPFYRDVDPRRPGYNHRGQKTSQTRRKKRYPEPNLKPTIPTRRRSRTAAKPSSERANWGANQVFDTNMNQKHRRHRRSFSEAEKAHMNAVRKAKACKECHDGHRKCPHVVPEANSGASQEPSPASDTGPVTPASAGRGVDSPLYDSLEDSGMDTPDEMMDSDMDIDAIVQVLIRVT